ncbi:MAG TPA: hypothetical protein VKQ29_07875, partial [Aliidongia sp.]|nr:hypothetical protein [Aliidongia sp.]
VAAARLIGDGFYGVDLKESEAGVFIIEINDNPNLDHGMEDRAAGDGVYLALLQRFVSLFEQRVGRAASPSAPARGPTAAPAPAGGVTASPRGARLVPFPGVARHRR